MGVTLYLLRHGQTNCSRDNDFCGSGMDPELTPEGAEMAEEFAEAYQTLPWEAIYCSPLQRAVATARPLADRLNLPLELRDDLKEIGYGAWEGKTVETARRDFHDDYILWTADPAWHPPTGGEPAVAIAHRVLQVVEEIQNRHQSGNVLVVSHKATIRILLCSLLGMDVGRFRFRLACPVGSVSVVAFGPEGPMLKVLADRSHQSERLRNLPGT